VHVKRFPSLLYVRHKPCTYLAPTLTLSPNELNEIPHEPHDLGVSSGACKMISKPIVCSAQTVHLSSINIKHYLQMDRNEYPLEPRHLGVPSGASKTISEPMVLWRKPCTYLALTVTLSPNGAK
jgi:hypothetical protein